MNVALIDADSIIHIVSYHNAIPTDMLSMLDDSDEKSKESAISALYPGAASLSAPPHC